MTQGLIRYQNSGDFHFVTFSCYRRQQYLGIPSVRSLFERSLETMRKRYNFFVFGYVVMPEHVHLLVSEPEKAVLSKAIQALKLSVAVQRPERPFWQSRYYDFNVHTNRKHAESSNTCTAIQSYADWLRNRRIESGQVFNITRQVR